MKILNFLEACVKKDFWKNKRVFCFIGKGDYPFLFFNKLFSFLVIKKILPAQHSNLIFDQIDKKELQSSLTQTFLGQEFFYWLGQCNVKATDKKGLKFVESFFTYSGPHFIAFYLNNNKLPKSISLNLKKIDVIELPESVDYNLFEKVINFFEDQSWQKNLVLAKKLVVQMSDSFQLDQIFMLMQYLQVTNTRNITEVLQYLSPIINQTSPSLNLLTQHFFAKNGKSFFKIWSQVAKDYAEMFWIAFWSEQIYKAYFVVNFLKQNKIAFARSLSFRLPFMFLKRDWKKFSLNQLANYYNFLYTCDFKLKTGAKFCQLDLFYLNHFKT